MTNIFDALRDKIDACEYDDREPMSKHFENMAEAKRVVEQLRSRIINLEILTHRHEILKHANIAYNNILNMELQDE